MILLFFARTNRHSIDHMLDIFMPIDGKVWFVEEIKSQKWITEDSDHVNHNGEALYSDHQLTDNPLLAKRFEAQMQALAYCIKNKLGEGFTQTEHDFPV